MTPTEALARQKERDELLALIDAVSQRDHPPRTEWQSGYSVAMAEFRAILSRPIEQAVKAVDREVRRQYAADVYAERYGDPSAAVLLRDTPEDRERLIVIAAQRRTQEGTSRERADAIIAALRDRNAGFYDDPNAEGNDR